MAELHSPLVSTQWLADHLGGDDLVVVDATVLPYTQPGGALGYLSGHESYLVHGHLPGAVFADLVDEFSDPDGRHAFTRPDAARFESAAGALGISNDTRVVVYDAVVSQWASRLWWLFRAFGYDNVAVLDGGYRKWIAEGRVSEIGHVEPGPARFLAAERPHLWVERADVHEIVAGAASAALLCAVPAREFAGDDAHGHIPGSVSAPAARLVDRGTNAYLPPEALRQQLLPVLEHDRVVAYCKGGIAAASNALALTLLGHGNVALYDGSLNDWDGALVTTAA